MKVKKYEAIDMPQALEMIKKELGHDAVILSTRKIRKAGSIFGLLGRPVIEVTAASDYDFNAKLKIKEKGAIRKDEMGWPAARFESLQDDINRIKDEMGALAVKQTISREEKEFNEFMANYSLLDKKVDVILKNTIENKIKNLPPASVNLYKTLTLNKVEAPLALKLIEFLEKKNHIISDDMDRADIMLKILSGSIKTSGPIKINGRQKVVALVGPTGVGKTTTIAKLAAIYSLQKKLKVGLITIDTYRIAAVEQIKTYARILDIPVEVAMAEDDIRTAFNNLKFKDLIIIDTAGMSPHNKNQMFELKNILTKKDIDLEAHLVLSLTTSLDDLFVAYNKFKELNFKNLLFTKFDETSSYGNILNLSLRTRMPISYIATGQNVPEDIMTAESENIAKLLLNKQDA
jgi:flagellar biosynthesis protein FlhF